MKKFILCVCSVCVLAAISSAQAGQKKKSINNQAGKAIKKQSSISSSNNTVKGQTVQLNSTSDYSARSNVSIGDQYRIADPTVKALNARASGADVQISKSGIVGMPKRAYGFGNGHLTLY